MGYKLAGYDVIGGIEIDPEMSKLYVKNLKPSLHLPGDIRNFNEAYDGAYDLEDLDILDGSPPCSSFSMAGSREDDWGNEKAFREGQAVQVLDDLFFHFIDTAKILKPKIVVAENVKGLIQGDARGYVKEIFQKFREAGYECQLFLLNSSRMGVPQARERTFFIARRMDLNLPKIELSFNEEPVTLRRAFKDLPEGHEAEATPLPPSLLYDYRRVILGKKKRYFSVRVAHPDAPSPTITSKTTTSEGSVIHWDGRKFSPAEAIRIQTFPDDYDFMGMDPGYVLGMSVPPFMMQRVAHAIHDVLKSV